MQTQPQLPKNAKVIEKLQKLTQNKKPDEKFIRIVIDVGNEGL
jgi:hypothetical protein